MLKTKAEVAKMRRAGQVVAEMHERIRAAIRPGVTTLDLDAIGREVLAQRGARSNFLGYHGYPAVICASPNDVIVHGIPSKSVRLDEGDNISIDCGAIVDGWHGDAAMTVVLDEADPLDVELARTTESAMWAGISALARAERLGAVGEAVEDVVDAAQAAGANGGERYGVIQEYVGHGIGSAMHQPPEVLNYRTRDRGARLRPGMCLAVEPMLVRGQHGTRVLEDEWTVVTSDGSRAAHWEHSVAVHANGIWVLTATDGGAAQLAPLGVTPVAP